MTAAIIWSITSLIFISVLRVFRASALMLARATRTVVVCDHGNPRNRRATERHGDFTKDRMTPANFLQYAHTELQAYPTSEHVAAEVVRISPREYGFDVLCNLNARSRFAKCCWS